MKDANRESMVKKINEKSGVKEYEEDLKMKGIKIKKNPYYWV
jgi:hypothetical protein